MHFFERNFVANKPITRNVDSRFCCLSDGLYDCSKGVNFLYINYGTKDKPLYRLASDAELAFSQSPDITSLIPPALQANLRLSIQSQPRNGKSVSVDTPVNTNFEMDEVARVGRDMLDKHNQQCIDDYNRMVDKNRVASPPSASPIDSTIDVSE